MKNVLIAASAFLFSTGVVAQSLDDASDDTTDSAEQLVWPAEEIAAADGVDFTDSGIDPGPPCPAVADAMRDECMYDRLKQVRAPTILSLNQWSAFWGDTAFDKRGPFETVKRRVLATSRKLCQRIGYDRGQPLGVDVPRDRSPPHGPTIKPQARVLKVFCYNKR